MKTYTHFDSEAGTLAVRFISHYRDTSDYGISLCRGNGSEARVSVKDGQVLDAVSPETFLKEYGFSFAVAANTVRAYVAERFDNDVREIVRMGLLEHSDASVKGRALALGLCAEDSPETRRD